MRRSIATIKKLSTKLRFCARRLYGVNRRFHTMVKELYSLELIKKKYSKLNSYRLSLAIGVCLIGSLFNKILDSFLIF